MVNREPGIALDPTRQRSFCAGQGELESEIVEGGAEVVDAVPSDKSQTQGRGFEDLCPNERLAALGVEFGPSSVRAFFAPGSQLRFKALQMVDRPIEPSFMVEGHD